MMILDGKVLKGDHSFKFSKHMAKIEDTSVFTGLYTMTNEYEEIVQQLLVPSKSLVYLKHSFEKMREAYSDYGHEMPVAFFTDNVKGDKAFVESVFESLKDNVKPLERGEMDNSETNTDDLSLPDNIRKIYICRNFALIEQEISICYYNTKK